MLNSFVLKRSLNDASDGTALREDEECSRHVWQPQQMLESLNIDQQVDRMTKHC